MLSSRNAECDLTYPSWGTVVPQLGRGSNLVDTSFHRADLKRPAIWDYAVPDGGGLDACLWRDGAN